MSLPIPFDLAPMEAKLVTTLPRGPHWQYEPKWDGFRCLAFKDGATVELRSKSGQPFNRYFPELVAALRALAAARFVVDGELVVSVENVLSFDALLMRIHPAQSRVDRLAREHPVQFILFDLLVDEKGRSLIDRPLAERRHALENFAKRHITTTVDAALWLSPATEELNAAERWLKALGAGLDGIVAKRIDLPYHSGDRTAAQKYKNMRTADCVVGGFRYASKARVVGSLLLGLYDDEHLLHHVGFAANIPAAERPALTQKLEALVKPPGFTGQRPGGPSRWSTERSGDWEPLVTKLVVEVQYD